MQTPHTTAKTTTPCVACGGSGTLREAHDSDSMYDHPCYVCEGEKKSPSGQELKDAGMKKRDQSPSAAILDEAFVFWIGFQAGEVTCDDFRIWLRESLFDAKTRNIHPNSYGPLFRRMALRGYLNATTRYEPCTIPTRHGGVSKVWEVVR